MCHKTHYEVTLRATKKIDLKNIKGHEWERYKHYAKYSSLLCVQVSCTVQGCTHFVCILDWKVTFQRLPLFWWITKIQWCMSVCKIGELRNRCHVIWNVIVDYVTLRGFTSATLTNPLGLLSEQSHPNSSIPDYHWRGHNFDVEAIPATSHVDKVVKT